VFEEILSYCVCVCVCVYVVSSIKPDFLSIMLAEKQLIIYHKSSTNPYRYHINFSSVFPQCLEYHLQEEIDLKTIKLSSIEEIKNIQRNDWNIDIKRETSPS
jgi:hypothetical protein